MAELLICNEVVAGSTPVAGSISNRLVSTTVYEDKPLKFQGTATESMSQTLERVMDTDGYVETCLDTDDGIQNGIHKAACRSMRPVVDSRETRFRGYTSAAAHATHGS